MDLVLNQNFYKYLSVILFGGSGYNGSYVDAQIGTAYSRSDGYYNNNGLYLRVPCSMIDTRGNNIPVAAFEKAGFSLETSMWNHSFFAVNWNQNVNVRFICGSGSTAAVITDTSLVVPNTDITATIETVKRDTETSVTYTVTFSSQTSQTLREIGLVRSVYTSDSPAYKEALLGRAVFDEDIALDANTSKTVQIRLALPTLA